MIRDIYNYFAIASESEIFYANHSNSLIIDTGVHEFLNYRTVEVAVSALGGPARKNFIKFIN